MRKSNIEEYVKFLVETKGFDINGDAIKGAIDRFDSDVEHRPYYEEFLKLKQSLCPQ